VDDPRSFDDFRPISLCNCIYKIIAKIITRRLKPLLLEAISKEQFGFLEGHQIHEAIGVSQEGLHSPKTAIKKGTILKIDLSKAYDRGELVIHLVLTYSSWVWGPIDKVGDGMHHFGLFCSPYQWGCVPLLHIIKGSTSRMPHVPTSFPTGS